MKFEDGRTGAISADLRIRDAAVFEPRGRRRPDAAPGARGDLSRNTTSGTTRMAERTMQDRVILHDDIGAMEADFSGMTFATEAAGRRVLRRGGPPDGGHRQALVLPGHLHRLRHRARGLGPLRRARQEHQHQVRARHGARGHQRRHARDHPPARAARVVPRQHLRLARPGDAGAGRDAQAARSRSAGRGGGRRRDADASSASTTSTSTSAASRRSPASASRSTAARSRRSSGPTAPARARCSTSSAASTGRRAAGSIFEGKDRTHLRGARRRPAGLRAHVPEHRAVQGHDARSTTS